MRHDIPVISVLRTTRFIFSVMLFGIRFFVADRFTAERVL